MFQQLVVNFVDFRQNNSVNMQIIIIIKIMVKNISEENLYFDN